MNEVPDPARETTKTGASFRPIQTTSLLEQLARLRHDEEAQRTPNPQWAPAWHAAATLVEFDPRSLWAAFGMTVSDATLTWLRQHAEPVHGGVPAADELDPGERDAPPFTGLWRLPLAERRRALHDAPGVDTLRYLRRQVPVAGGAEQRMADALLFGTLGDISSLSVGELASVIEARSWYDGVLLDMKSQLGLPDEAKLRARLALAQLLEPMRRLVGRHFVGRTAELGRLTDYVGVLGPQKLAGSAALGAGLRALRRVRRSLIDNPPLYVCGPGGVGKSSLIARFILDHMDSSRSGELPFVLLDFDRAQVESRMPLSLLVAALHQLSVQVPEHADAMRRMAQSLMQVMRSSSALELSSGDSSQATLVRDFAKQVDEMLGGKDEATPLLWVLDTFEEPQRLGESTVGALWELMNTLQEALPRLRLVVCGRVVPAGFAWDEVPLDDFDEPSAKSYLRWRLSEASSDQPSDEESLVKLIKVVGRTPLALRLAVRLIVSGDSALLNLKLRRERIQAVLFHRVLDHIRVDDGQPLGTQWIDRGERQLLQDELKRLVFPGLAVRRITPGVIEHVLARPCAVPIRDAGHAGRLFAALAQQVDIVEPGDSDDGEPSLLHRTDVRRMMLRDLEEKAGEATIRRIDRRAVIYHARTETLAHCAEEIYHRLRLGQSDVTIRLRWEEGLDRYLLPAVEELKAPAARALLADLLGVTLDAAALEGAKQDAWERQTARRAAEYLRAANPERAMQVMYERANRLPSSALLRLEVQALLQLGEFPAAAERAQRALAEAAEAGEQAAAADAALLMAQAEEALGDLERSAERVQEASAWAAQLGDANLALRAGVALLRLARKGNVPSVDRVGQAQNLAALLDVDTLRGLRSRPALLRELLAEIGSSHPRLLRLGLGVLGVDLPSERDARGLAEVVMHWFDDRGSSMRDVAASFGLKSESGGPDIRQWADWLWRAAPKEIGSLLLRLMKDVPPHEQVRTAIAELFRRDVDRRLTRAVRQRAV